MKQISTWLVAAILFCTLLFASVTQAAEPSTAATAATAAIAMFAFGTFWFWISCVAIIIILFLCIENETGVGATVALVIYGVLLQWLSNVDIIGFVIDSPMRTLAFAGAYIGIGVVWSAFRFWWFMGAKVQKIKDGERSWVINKMVEQLRESTPNRDKSEWRNDAATVEAQYNANGMPQSLYEAWNNHVDENSPKAIENKGFIMRSMGYWPISMVWFVLSDFVTELFAKIYHRLSKVYENIADSVKNTAKKK